MLGTTPGSDFEAIDESSLQVNGNSGQSPGSISSVSTPLATHAAIASTTRTHAPSSVMTPEIADLIYHIHRHNAKFTKNLLFLITVQEAFICLNCC
jgi:hypothetical protein